TEKRLLGNFPQAFTHVMVIAAAQFLEEKEWLQNRGFRGGGWFLSFPNSIWDLERGRHACHYSKSLSPAQVVGRDLLTRRCRWIFGGYRLLQRGRSARPGGAGLHDRRLHFPKR